jgi:protein-S-isoprenylcysteine O-methyltransferase Ste14
MLGRIAYGTFFCIILPLALAWWTALLPVPKVLPHVHLPIAGIGIAIFGAALMLWSMWKLWREGGGLPMNAFPPPRRVTSGPYAITHHPIYAGFVLVISGVSIATGSTTGLWITTPLTALGCIALVYGYERRDLIKRLGPATTPPFLAIPTAASDQATTPTARERWSAATVILLPWLVLYEAIGHIHAGPEISTWLRIEHPWPVVPWTEFIYILAYPLTIAAPILARRRSDLRRFSVAGLTAMVIAFWLYLSLPVITPPKHFEATGLAADLLRYERLDGLAGRAAFPSFHVAWAMIAAMTLWSRGVAWRLVTWPLAIAITISCITTGMHGLLDCIGGIVLFVAAWNARAITRWLLASAQAVANAWREVRIGRVRILMHAIYAGLAACTGSLLALALLDEPWHVPFLIVAFSGLIGAGIWGQIFESSSGLSRPFGYYGHVIGCGVALAALTLVHGNVWPLAAAMAAIAPWVQAIGRLRCLVQGCCHGAPITCHSHGIRHTHPDSRVVKLAKLGDVPIHATALYSLLLNVLIGGPILRMWSAGADAALIVGTSLVLTGLARFVEESYRGEPQTAIIRGLRAYQWLAILTIVIGMSIMPVQAGAVVVSTRLAGQQIAISLAIALVYAAAMGMDLPSSRKRLSRLA